MVGIAWRTHTRRAFTGHRMMIIIMIINNNNNKKKKKKGTPEVPDNITAY
jgi:hypothetical protein